MKLSGLWCLQKQALKNRNDHKASTPCFQNMHNHEPMPPNQWITKDRLKREIRKFAELHCRALFLHISVALKNPLWAWNSRQGTPRPQWNKGNWEEEALKKSVYHARAHKRSTSHSFFLSPPTLTVEMMLTHRAFVQARQLHILSTWKTSEMSHLYQREMRRRLCVFPVKSVSLREGERHLPRL